DGGARLTGRAVGGLRAGDRVRVAVRPEDFAVAGSGPGPDGAAGEIGGTVAVVEYHGREHAVSVQAGDVMLHARSATPPAVGGSAGPVPWGRPNGRRPAVGVQRGAGMLHARSAAPPAVGGAVRLTAPVERVLVFPESLDAPVPQEVAA